MKEIKYYFGREKEKKDWTIDEIDDILSAGINTNTKEILKEILDSIRKANKFDGKLKKEQYKTLIENGLSSKKIKKIEYFLNKHKEGLTYYIDLVGDDLIPGSFFFYNMKHFGYLLDLEKENASSLEKMKFKANVTIPIIKRIGKHFLKSKQIFENRNELLAYSKIKKELEKEGLSEKINDNNLEFDKDSKIILPDEPVIWTMNHGFKDDVLASVLSVSRPFSMFFGSIPQFYNTFDGILAYNLGSIVINRKSRDSKIAAQEKAKNVINSGLDIMMSPEGVWNKTPHNLLVDFWPGVYRLAKETNSKVVPIVHYIYDPTQRIPRNDNPIHTVIDDPIDITYMPEKEALEYYRDILATWYYIMMEKYGQTTRKKLLNGYNDMYSAYEDVMQSLITTVDIYDSEFETKATYNPKEKIKPEDVFTPIANIKPTKENILHQQYAKKLVLTRKKEDYQGRY